VHVLYCFFRICAVAAERTNGIRIHLSEQKVVPLAEELVLKYKLSCRDGFLSFDEPGIIPGLRHC